VPIRMSPDPTFAISSTGPSGPWSACGCAAAAPGRRDLRRQRPGLDAHRRRAQPQRTAVHLAQLQAVYGPQIAPLVRPPSGDSVTIEQYLDLGVQNLLVPMIDTAEQAADVVRAVTYPPHGIRGVGSALARASRWNHVDDSFGTAADALAVYGQVERAEAVANVEAIVATPGIDGIFIGPSDLAASIGVLGQQDHADVVAAVEHCLAVATAADMKADVNASPPPSPGATSTQVPTSSSSAPTCSCSPAAARSSPPTTSRRSCFTPSWTKAPGF